MSRTVTIKLEETHRALLERLLAESEEPVLGLRAKRLDGTFSVLPAKHAADFDVSHRLVVLENALTFVNDLIAGQRSHRLHASLASFVMMMSGATKSARSIAAKGADLSHRARQDRAAAPSDDDIASLDDLCGQGLDLNDVVAIERVTSAAMEFGEATAQALAALQRRIQATLGLDPGQDTDLARHLITMLAESFGWREIAELVVDNHENDTLPSRADRFRKLVERGGPPSENRWFSDTSSSS